MDNPDSLLYEYEEAMNRFKAHRTAQSTLHRSTDAAAFRSLRAKLTPVAEAGHAHCQYALATILGDGLCYDNDYEQLQHQKADTEEASRWWDASAALGYWPALDNLIASGVGPAAEKAREALGKLEGEWPEYSKAHKNLPMYGPDFMKILLANLYGHSEK